ncbi:hypothetical protein NL676_012551 [Syzygium grande]|nr:hypothetical protein NL676_012551 [Syzygium grande]
MDKDLSIPRKKLPDLAVVIPKDAVAEVRADRDNGELREDGEPEAGLFGGEERGPLELTSLSSSLMVSSICDVLRLMTLTNCGGAASMTNLAILEFTILSLQLGFEVEA